jgi:hypothetical protein
MEPRVVHGLPAHSDPSHRSPSSRPAAFTMPAASSHLGLWPGAPLPLASLCTCSNTLAPSFAWPFLSPLALLRLAFVYRQPRCLASSQRRVFSVGALSSSLQTPESLAPTPSPSFSASDRPSLGANARRFPRHRHRARARGRRRRAVCRRPVRGGRGSKASIVVLRAGDRRFFGRFG